MKLYKIFIALAVAIVATLSSLATLASTGAAIVADTDMPAWAYAALAIVGAASGIAAQLDAQLSESFKHKWPWWLRLAWDCLAGNYKHSRNIGSQ